MTVQAQHLLKSVFGYDSFRLDQEKIIQSVLSGKDTLAIMPTGGGKSLCYQIPALIFPGLTIVISPLISLMKDQVQQLQQLNIEALYLNSSLGKSEYEQNMTRLYSGKVKMLYLAPETLFIDRIQQLLSQVKIDCFTIDEAHCISDWGHDFRPEYRKLLEFKRKFPQAITIALTATATQKVRADIQNQLNIPPAQQFVSSFDRQNLKINVLPKKDPVAQVFEIIKKFENQSGIIYCFSKNQVDELTSILKVKGMSVKPYHAGLGDVERSTNQELFIKDDVQIIVATVAFGMGINKPNVRFVIHYDLPKNLESYYQEIGRAGRDGLDSECFLLYSHGDTQKIQFFIKQKEEPEKSNSSKMLADLVRFAETEECKRIELLKYFSEVKTENCQSCSSCLADLSEKIELSVAAQKFMSCVKKSGERFGANHIIDILRGSKNQKIEDMGHNNLSTYNIGKEFSKSQWQYIARQMIQGELLIQDIEFGGLSLGPNAMQILTAKEAFLGRILEPKKSELKAQSSTRVSEDGPFDEALFQLLRTYRKTWADAQNVAPYMIFSDKTLMDLSRQYPQNNDDLSKIYGIGQGKIERYGVQTLKVIEDYCTENQITRPEPQIQIPSTPKSSSPGSEKETLFAESGISTLKMVKIQHAVEKYEAGVDLSEIAQSFGVQEGTILSYFDDFLTTGGVLKRPFNIEHLNFSDSEIAQVHLAFIECGTDRLRPIFEALGEKVSFEAIKLLRLAYLNVKNQLNL
jgi:ATP-dependent DNA helicase RecQ